jgi:hypothetical protein
VRLRLRDGRVVSANVFARDFYGKSPHSTEFVALVKGQLPAEVADQPVG